MRRAGALTGLARPLIRSVVDWVLPPRCPTCGELTPEDAQFCLDCWSDLHFIGADACRGCARPLAVGESERCAACLANPHAFDSVTAAVAYGEISRTLVLRMKHGRRPALARVAARLMAPQLHGQSPGLILPVPLHHWRLWRRGFNQSWAIARHLARGSGWPADAQRLVRTRNTPRLVTLSPQGRKRAVTGAFAVRGRLSGCVWLIDDVMTSGATADACARALKQAGADEVHVLVWARVV